MDLSDVLESRGLTARQKQVVEEASRYVMKRLPSSGAAHDWWHVLLVVNLAIRIWEAEGGDLFTIILGALFHDLADWKFEDAPEKKLRAAREWFRARGVNRHVVSEVLYIAKYNSFMGGTNDQNMRSLEGRIVQDADINAGIGLIGIARSCALGGYWGRALYNPEKVPKQYGNFDEFKALHMQSGTTYNYLLSKVERVLGKLNTETGRRLAELRVQRMIQWLQQFMDEVEVRV